MVVDERGAVLPGSIRVQGEVSEAFAAGLRDTAARFRFRPARRGGCWVPAEYVYRVHLW